MMAKTTKRPRQRKAPPLAEGKVQRKPERRAPAPERSIVQVKRAPSAPRAAPVVQIETEAGPIDKLSNEGFAIIEEMDRLHQDLFRESLEGCQDQLAAFDLDPDDLDTVPAHWRAELRDELAVKRRHAIAKAALLPSRSAPAALETMRAMVNQTVRARGREHGMTVHRLNVAVVVGGVKHEYSEIEIGAEEE